ncbi:MAG TPA: hypothetical protein VM120_01700 [Bryobacteraceae bacterium]|nr:hypothetical protein [Bryobacteraceae bacterium]
MPTARTLRKRWVDKAFSPNAVLHSLGLAAPEDKKSQWRVAVHPGYWPGPVELDAGAYDGRNGRT